MTQALHDKIHAELASREQELIDIHRTIVRIPSVNRGDGSPVGEDRVAAAGIEYLKRASAAIKTEQVGGEPGRDNLLAEIGSGVKGSGAGGAAGGASGASSSASATTTKNSGASGHSMLWMSHSDVVPAGDESAWKFPPFSAEIAEGRIWGRGSNDCKMLVAAQLFAMANLARLGLPERGSLRLAVGADEEVGGALGFGWLGEHRPDFLRCDIAICEGGGGSLGRWGAAEPYVSVGSGEKGRYDVTFTVKGDGGHASTPWGKGNPLLTVAELSRRVDAWRPEAHPVSPIFHHVAEWVGLSGGVDDSNLEAAIARVEKKSPSLGRSLRAQSRIAFTPTVVHAGDKANAIPTTASLICDARLLPGQSKDDLDTIVKGIVAGLPKVEYRIDETTEPSVSPLTDDLRAMFKDASERALGAPVRIVPTWCAGATDARFVRDLGTPVYGYQLVHPEADDSRLGIHCIDESIEVKMLMPCALSLAHLAVEYLK